MDNKVRILAEVTGRILLPFTEIGKPGEGTSLRAECNKFSFRTCKLEIFFRYLSGEVE